VKIFFGNFQVSVLEKHDIFGKTFFGRFDPQNGPENRPKPVFWIFELLPQHKKLT